MALISRPNRPGLPGKIGPDFQTILARLFRPDWPRFSRPDWTGLLRPIGQHFRDHIGSDFPGRNGPGSRQDWPVLSQPDWQYFYVKLAQISISDWPRFLFQICRISRPDRQDFQARLSCIFWLYWFGYPGQNGPDVPGRIGPELQANISRPDWPEFSGHISRPDWIGPDVHARFPNFQPKLA